MLNILVNVMLSLNIKITGLKHVLYYPYQEIMSKRNYFLKLTTSHLLSTHKSLIRLIYSSLFYLKISIKAVFFNSEEEMQLAFHSSLTPFRILKDEPQ